MRHSMTRFTIHGLLIYFYLFTVAAPPVFSSSLAGLLHISTEKPALMEGVLTLAESGRPIPWFADEKDYPGVRRVLGYIQADIEKVTGQQPEVNITNNPHGKQVVLVGTLGKSALINQLMNSGKVQTELIQGKWESTLIKVVDHPLTGVDKALVIIGSDKRGTLYGILEISKRIGVSPWTWWADVPVRSCKDLYVSPGQLLIGEPKVKYRGIFLNDEEPALGRWVVENYGGFNHQFYEKLFELILRLKGNFLWPAMWWAAFNADDPENPKLADEMGIVMSTSHHEPMMRAHAEWKPYGGKEWNYETNAEQLQRFWREGIERMDEHESVVTLAMRGDGDRAMSDSTNIALLEQIVRDQRKILAEVTGKDVTEIPQVWALYKEVQDYYDKGMRVPDDVTLLLCDDNWGNVRRLPRPDDPPRIGGYGMYYHFDFVGGPRNYKWLNTKPISRIWEQMHLCYKYGVDRIWLVNVGDLKPMEFPISFFLDYAWDPDQLPAERLPEYTRRWAEQQFGPEHTDAIAEILTAYTRYNSRRTPEMLDADTYSLTNYREWEVVTKDYLELDRRAEQIGNQLGVAYQDAYYELVLHPVRACANLYELYWTVARNRQYAKQGRAITNDLAERVEDLFQKDQEISDYYNHVLAGGKWNHMMDQTHIGYTYWQQPEKNTMPKVRRIDIPEGADMGIAIEGSDQWWPAENGLAVLPDFDCYNRQTHYFEVFNRGQKPFHFSVHPESDWVICRPNEGSVDKEQRIEVSVNWKTVPSGKHQIPVRVSGPNGEVIILLMVNNPVTPEPASIKGFIEADGVVAIEAVHCTGVLETPIVHWLCIPDLGRTLSGITPIPVTAASQSFNETGPRLEYNLYLFTSGTVEVQAYFSPTQDFNHSGGLRYGISFDDESPQRININQNDTIPDWKYPMAWNEAVGRNIKITTSIHHIEEPGLHVLKYWMVDPGIVLQRLVVNAGGLKPSYLGPPESYCTEKQKGSESEIKTHKIYD
jgi:hypothetical protein